MRAILHIDGASRGNPGPAAIGVVIADEDGTVLAQVSEYIGQATNNVAEYKALLRGLKEAERLGAESLLIYGDSQLMIRQMNREYRVRHPGLLPLYNQAQDLVRVFAMFLLCMYHEKKMPLPTSWLTEPWIKWPVRKLPP